MIRISQIIDRNCNDASTQRFLILGGTGMMGASIACMAQRTGHAAVVTDVRTDGPAAERLRRVGIPVRHADATDAAAVRRAAEAARATIIINCAGIAPAHWGENPVRAAAVTVEAALIAADVAKSIGLRLVHTSSRSVYGRPGGVTTLNEIQPVEPETPYGRAKVEAEAGLLNMHAAGDLDLRIVRSSGVFGPSGPWTAGAANRRISTLVAKIKIRGRVHLVGTPNDSADEYLTASDFAAAVIDLATVPALPHGMFPAFNVGPGKVLTARQIYETLADIFPYAKITYSELSDEGEPIRPLNITKIRAFTGWFPVDDLAKGIQRLLDGR